MWKCENCNEKLEESFDACWNCGFSRKVEQDCNIQEPVFDEDKEDRDKASSLKEVGHNIVPKKAPSFKSIVFQLLNENKSFWICFFIAAIFIDLVISFLLYIFHIDSDIYRFVTRLINTFNRKIEVYPNVYVITVIFVLLPKVLSWLYMMLTVIKTGKLLNQAWKFVAVFIFLLSLSIFIFGIFYDIRRIHF